MVNKLTQCEKDQQWMKLALEMAKKAEANGEVPVGAVLVKNDEVIAAGFNLCISQNDPTAHAEIQCLRQAGKVLNNYRLLDTSLYVTLEPCAMCAAAIVHGRVKRVVFGAKDPKTGAVVSVMNLFEQTSVNHKICYTEGVLENECGKILSDFFKRRRLEKKSQKKIN